MKFIDSISELKLHYWNDFLKKKRACIAIDQAIEQQVDTIDMLRCFIADTEKQISAWEEEQRKNPKAIFHDEIEIFKVIADFFRLNGRLVLIELRRRRILMRYLNDEIIPDQLRYCNVLYEHMPIVLSATHNLNNIEYS